MIFSNFTRRLTSIGYQLIRPLLFRSSPDNIHNSLLKLGVKVQKSKFILWVLKTFWAYENKGMLSQTFRGVEFINPVGLSAGFDKNIQLPPIMKAVGFGFMTGGSITALKTIGNPRPWFRRLPKLKSLAVNAGLSNDGSIKIVRRIKNYPKKTFDNFTLMISVAPTNNKAVATHTQAIADCLKTLTRIKNIAQAIEINISCPNALCGQLFTNPKTLEDLLAAVDKLNLSQPVFIKMPSSVSNKTFLELLGVARKHNITGATICNLNKDYSKFNIPEDTVGGLSGRPVYERSNELIKLAYEKYGKDLVIIGVGGIFSPQDAYTKIRLGASMVGLITGVIYKGPQIVGDLNHQLCRLLEKDGFTHISQAIGIDTVKGNM